jgi:hypothetical protein
MKVSRPKLSRLYEADETAWLEQMAQLIEERQFDKLDYKNLTEFLQSMAKRDRREVLHRLTTLLMHLLKWDFQTENRSRSWEQTIRTQRHALQDLLTSKTLRNHAQEILAKAYERAAPFAAAETDLPEETFPASCPYTLDEILGAE